MLDKTSILTDADLHQARLEQMLYELRGATSQYAPVVPKKKASNWRRQQRADELLRQRCLRAALRVTAAGYLLTRCSLASEMKISYTGLNSILEMQSSLKEELQLQRHPNNAPTLVPL